MKAWAMGHSQNGSPNSQVQWGMELSGSVMRGCGDIMLTICMPGMAPNVTATSIQGLAIRQ